MDDHHHHDAQGGGYRPRSDDAWAAARADYQSGLSASEVCARHDLSLSTFRQRAAAEGWRRRDQADPVPDESACAPHEDFDPLPSLDDMAERVLYRIDLAISRGRASEAGSWMRLYERLLARRRIEDETPPEPSEPPAPPPPPPPAPDPADAARRHVQRVGDLARRVALTDLRDSVAVAAIEREMAELQAVILPGEAPDLDDSHHSHPVFSPPPP